MAALGGISSPAGSCVWHVVGLQRSVRDWAIRQGWGGRPVDHKAAAGILIAALGCWRRTQGTVRRGALPEGRSCGLGRLLLDRRAKIGMGGYCRPVLAHSILKTQGGLPRTLSIPKRQSPYNDCCTHNIRFEKSFIKMPYKLDLVRKFDVRIIVSDCLPRRTYAWLSPSEPLERTTMILLRVFALWISAAVLTTGLSVTEAGAQEVVLSFAPFTPTPTNGVWFESDVRAGGAASTEDLTGLGGNLETDQPLPIGAALLTTGFSNDDKAEVGVTDSYGMTQDIFATLELFYSYYKAGNPGQNASAAPSLRLAIYNPVCDDVASGGDCYGQLVYEPYWNIAPPAAPPVPTDEWRDVAIDGDSGLFWWTGGFGQPNGAGGPPLRTLNDWLNVPSTDCIRQPPDKCFSSDFDDAYVVMVSIGVGTFNQGQIGYFDDVQITHQFGDGFDEWYDFEPAIGPPVDKNECKNGGWMTFNNPAFPNQGQCVSFVVSNRDK
jgi:hypothetical protein